MDSTLPKEGDAPPYQESGDELFSDHDESATNIVSITDRLQEANITAGQIKPYNCDLEKFTDLALKECKIQGCLNTNGPPDLNFAIKCLAEDHKVTKELNKGYFVISGKELSKLSPRQMISWPDSCETKGCGYDGCQMTLIDSLTVIMELEKIMCYECKTADVVIAGEGCPAHSSTKCESLVLVVLGHLAKWYKLRSLQISSKGYTIPTITIQGKTDQQYIVDLNLGLRAHPWVRLKLPNLVDQFI